MITLQNVESIIGMITFLLAYVVAVTLAGGFRAWVARLVGDPTAESMGFLTLNPSAHVEPIGIVFVVLTYFGWSRYIPINPINIRGPVRWLKIGVAYIADTIAYLVMTFAGLMALVLMFGSHILNVAYTMLLRPDYMSHLVIARSFPDHSSLVVSLGFIIIAFAYLSIVLAALDLIINLCHLGMFLLSERSPHYTPQNVHVTLVLPMILIIFFTGPLRAIMTYSMFHAGFVLAHLLGIA